MPGIYVIRLDLPDGTSEFPAMVVREGSNWEADLDEAEAYYRAAFAGRGVLSFEYATRLSVLGLPNAASLQPWHEIRAELGRGGGDGR